MRLFVALEIPSEIRENLAALIRELRAVAISVLTGLALYYAYLVVPPFGARALGAAALAIIVIGVVVTVLAGRPIRGTAVGRRALRVT